MKKVLALLVSVLLLLAMIPMGAVSVSAASLSQSQFDAKLSSARASYPTGSQREEWSINGTVVGWQCHGYGRWLSWYVWGVDFANGEGTGWTLRKSSSTSSYINSLVPGDVVRFRRISSGKLKSWNHTIFITSIIGSTVYYTDCNSDGACTIKWEQSVSKSTLDSWLKLPLYGSEAATYGYIAHYTPNTLTGGTVSCNCSSSYAGTYICTTSSLNLTIRSGHGSSYSAIGSIPPGATVTVSKASGTSSSDWAHVTYNGVTGYASMEYLKKQGANHAATPTIRWWLSDTEYGDSVDNCKVGNRYYFCYRLYDSVTGKDWDEVSSNNYTVNIAVYNPNGSLNYDSTKSSDTGWISIFYTTAGTYTRKVVVDGDFLFEGSREFYVSPNPKTVHTSTNSISLNLSGSKSQTIYVWSSGYYSGNANWSWSSSNSNISCTWGEWTEDNRLPLMVNANSVGTSTLTLSLKDRETGAVLDSASIPVTINVNAAALSVNSSNSVTISSGGTIKYYTYTPTTSGKYVIYSTSSDDTKVYLYNENWTELTYNDDGGEASNFRLEYNLTAGTKYNFGVKYYDSSKTGTISFKFGKVYTITYNANGGSGAPAAQSKDYGTTIALSNTKPIRTGYTFLGWSTSSSAVSHSYSSGSQYTGNSDVVLYAVWEKGCAGSHNYYNYVSKQATCGSDGVRTYVCNDCQQSYTNPIPATGNHTYTNACDVACNTCGATRSVTHSYAAATCTAPETCRVCGHTQGSALGHKYDDDYDATCNVCGEEREVPEKPPVTPDLPADAPAFVVESTTAREGEEFTVAIRTQRNSGIVSMKLSVAYDADVLELIALEEQDFANVVFSPLTKNPFMVNWADAISPNNTTDGVVVLATFRVKEGAPLGKTEITLTYDPEDVYDENYDNVAFRVENGSVEIVDYIPGDVNADGRVNNKDLGLLQQYLSGWDVRVDEKAGDVNNDGRVNNKDLGLFQQYLSGWDVELG